MKYLTKDWYNKMQSSSIHILLKVDKRAEEFSEEFYKEIYKKEKQKYITKQTNVNNLLSKMMSKKELEANSKQEVDYAIQFDNIQKITIEDLNKKLPNDIKNEVKDIRVLALNYASKKVYNLIKKYSEDNEKYVDNKFREYIKLEKETFKDELSNFLDISFHDCYIKNVKNNGKDLSIDFVTGGLSEKENIVLENCTIKLDENIEECIWLYEEIYRIDNKYELHILAIKDTDLKEMIIECDNITVK